MFFTAAKQSFAPQQTVEKLLHFFFFFFFLCSFKGSWPFLMFLSTSLNLILIILKLHLFWQKLISCVNSYKLTVEENLQTLP